jgi:transcriptional regulator with XRE-family HTH domain
MARKPVFVRQGDPETIPAVWILARNLKAAMEAANGGEGISQNALAAKSKVAQTGIGYMLNPEAASRERAASAPPPPWRAIEKVAHALGLEAWQLLHPNPAEAPLSDRQRRLFDQLKGNMAWLGAPATAKPVK